MADDALQLSKTIGRIEQRAIVPSGLRWDDRQSAAGRREAFHACRCGNGYANGVTIGEVELVGQVVGIGDVIDEESSESFCSGRATTYTTGEIETMDELVDGDLVE